MGLLLFFILYCYKQSKQKVYDAHKNIVTKG